VKQKLKLVGWVALVVFILDHITKWLIIKYIPMGGEVTFIPHIFDVVHGRNTGAAFGLFSGWQSEYKNLVFYGIGILALIFLYYYIKSVPQSDKISLTGLAFILGGALGNVTDRFFRGSVVDFLSVHYYDRIWEFAFLNSHFRVPLIWPAFNVADMAITIAVFMLIVQNLRSQKKI